MKRFNTEATQALLPGLKPVSRSDQGGSRRTTAFKRWLLSFLALGLLGGIGQAQQPLIITPKGDANFSGAVGIGTNTTSDWALTLRGKTSASNWIMFEDNTGKRHFHFTLNGGGFNLAETGIKDYRLFVQSATGNVGIGTNNTTQKLTVDGNAVIGNAFIGNVGHGETWAAFSSSGSKTVTGYALIQSTDGKNTYINKEAGDGSIGFRIANVDKMVIANNGNVGIGISPPGAKLDIGGGVLLNGTAGQNFFKDSEKSDGAGLRVGSLWHSYGIYASTGKGAVGGADGVDLQNGKLVIDSSGNVTIAGKLFVKGILAYQWGTEWKQLYQERDGWAGSRNTSERPSDKRLKSDLRTITSPLEKLNQLRGVTYRWNEQGLQYLTRDIDTTLSAGPGASDEDNQKLWQAERAKRYKELSNTTVGVIAQDVEAVLPQAVTTDGSGYKSVIYSELIPLVIEALKEEDSKSQEQARIIASQQAEIQKLTVANQAAQLQLNEMQEVKRKLGKLEASMNRLMAGERFADKKETAADGQSAAQSLPLGSK